MPKRYNPYNCSEIFEIAPTQTTCCDRPGSSAAVLISYKKEMLKPEFIKEKVESYLKEPLPDVAGCVCVGYTTKEGTYNLLGITQKSNSVKKMKDYTKNQSSVDIDDYDIRKLTEKECFRLMGVDDADIEKISHTGISMCQQYKMAGNSIVVDVLSEIYKKLFADCGYTTETPLRVFTTFSGYDSQCLGLKRADIPYDLIGWSEIDKCAIQAHDAIFPQYKDRCYGDITKIDWDRVEDFDFLTYSSPCQDISVAGKQMGLDAGSGTRSSLLWEIEKAIEKKKPKYLLMENVKALTSKKFLPDFERWLQLLENYGYKSYWKVLNSKDYGVPQNRERVFVVSIRDDGDDQKYEFPTPIPLQRTLSDLLEKDEDVNLRYYLTDKQKNSIKSKMTPTE